MLFRSPGMVYSIAQLIGYPNVTVNVSGGRIMLEGTVENQYEKNRAEKIAASFGGEVINLLEMTKPKQVRIESRVVEISSSKAKNLGISVANVTGSSSDLRLLHMMQKFALSKKGEIQEVVYLLL